MWSGTFGTYPNPARGGSQADWVFTSRSGGVSRGVFESLNLAAHVGDDPRAVAANRDRLALTVGVAPATLAVIKAEHGNKVHEVTAESVTSIPVADALVTVSEDVTLVALAADCAPVVLADTKNRVAGVVHCGWRGVVAGVIPATIDKMLELGASAPSVSAVVGPTICNQCYVVDADCADQLMATAPGSTVADGNGQWHVDVAGAMVAQLALRGVVAERIRECTFTNSDLFSYRRDRTTGRQGAAIVLRRSAGAR